MSMLPDVPQVITTGNAQDVLGNSHLRKVLCYSKHPLSSLLFNTETHWFTNQKGAIGFFQDKNLHMCVGGILAPGEERVALLQSFLSFTREKRAFPVFLHGDESDFALLRNNGFFVNQLGASYSVLLDGYSMTGKRFQQLRNKISKSRRAGVSIREICSQEEYYRLKPQLEHINQLWLKEKHAKALKKLVIDFNTVEVNSGEHRVYIATRGEQIQAYIVYSYTWGETSGWFHNLSRKKPDIPDGTMQFINETAINDFLAEGAVSYLHMGFTPLVEFGEDSCFNDSAIFHKIAKWMSSKGGIVYPAASQRQYKMSWRPSLIAPEYIAFPKGKAMKALWSTLRTTNSI
ncbi:MULTISPECIES: DUF2156 domain-containing protein [Photorhabdus]|uniref:Phosphatidylglycerol lysyltransferase C-terminal domain-containing protein n=2 Tax=Photorhabdus asymbiotica TaxID=291112 RepID=B6VMD8_PHOAA|nr:DUF2156 domain-containing protein [Photorhabdus asymbiotica]RKS58143.1 uncharacterized protein DUF2156 [Photorhabdus asymbiotica]CAQ82520.1 conserved hypothetical protein [Photorhabdus asymbiotica]CAR67318.1 Hypothetical Protein PA-RVA12-2466 [Photorhabdus asymbiotica subsp. asymbiotica ATCC 43949]